MKYTLEIYAPSIGASARLHHRQEFNFDEEYQAAYFEVAEVEA